MQSIELPREIQINPKKHNEKAYYGFSFKNLKDGRPIRLRHRQRFSRGSMITSAHNLDMNLMVALSREGTNFLSLVLFSLTYLRAVKRIVFPIQANQINSRHILRFYSKKQKLLHYHESQANIEIRNSVTLKLVNTFSLAGICKEVGLSNIFSDLRTSVDLDYIPHLSSIILLLDSKVVLVSEKTAKQTPAVIFDIEGTEKYINITYKEKRRELLVVGMTSLLLMTVDDVGVSQLRILTSNKLCRSCRFLCWNPIEGVIMLSQRISQKAENFHILSYSTPNLTHIASLLNIPSYGNSYDEDSQTFVFVEGEASQQRVSFLSLKDINTRLESLDKPVILEGECMVYLPTEELQTDRYSLRYHKDTLYLRSNPNTENDFTR